MKRTYVIGVDEAGRGPLAGPVAVGAVRFPPGFDWKLIRGVRDSKKLSAAQREAWYARLRALERDHGVRFAVSFASAQTIDRIGITRAVSRALARALARLDVQPEQCRVRLDGSLFAPAAFTSQETIIRGDDTVPAISLASIAAKVQRDRRMRAAAKRFPGYAFEVHKGYGTREHIAAICRHGLCELHRRSFCRKLAAIG